MVDAEENRLSNTLRIANFPTIVLISKDGSVIFHGNPGVNEFWNKLKKLSPKIDRPQSPNNNLPGSDELKSSENKEEE